MKREFMVILGFFLLVLLNIADAAGGDSMTKDIHWLGHDTFRINAEKVIFTDPFRIKKNDKADIILITHEHRDHCSPEDIVKLLGAETIIITTADCAEKIKGQVKKEKIKTVKPGDVVEVMGIKFETVPAYNTNKQFHPRDKGWVGYIFTLQGRRIYLAGDTDYIPEMKDFKVDLALLPVSGTYVMTAEEAVRAALDIKPRVAIPMHYGAIVGSKEDALKFAEALKGKIEVRILQEE